MTLSRIRLELARDHDFPQGSREHGYEFTVPLDGEGRIDASAWKDKRDLCRVRRFWKGEEDEIGHVIRRTSGDWAFLYDLEGDPDDIETGYRLGQESFVPGEYVSIKEHDEVMRTFRVVTVLPLTE
jgi:hypothetical protein